MTDDIQDVPPRATHLLFALVFVGLLVVHIGGALHCQLRKGDTLSRMGIRWFSEYGIH